MKKLHLILLAVAVFVAAVAASMPLALYFMQHHMDRMENIAEKRLMNNAIYSTALTAKQQNVIAYEYSLCSTRADNQEDMNACWQVRYDLIDKFMLENYIANQGCP